MKAGMLAAACATLPLKSVLGQNGQSSGLPTTLSNQTGAQQLSYYTESSFAPYVNTQFSVYLNPSSTRDLKLVQVTDYLSAGPQQARSSSNQTDCFSLLWTGQPGMPFEQNTYLIEHDALGNFYMFLVPVGGKKGKQGLDYYEAVVYRNPELPPGYEIPLNDNSTGKGQATQAQPPVTTSGQPVAVSPGGTKTEQEVFFFRPE
jgi:hypothetical protein